MTDFTLSAKALMSFYSGAAPGSNPKPLFLDRYNNLYSIIINSFYLFYLFHFFLFIVIFDIYFILLFNFFIAWNQPFVLADRVVFDWGPRAAVLLSVVLWVHWEDLPPGDDSAMAVLQAAFRVPLPVVFGAHWVALPPAP